MPTTTILKNDQVAIYYHEDMQIIHQVYEPSIAGEPLREALNTGVDLMKQSRANKWLSDNRAVPVLSEEDTKWINTHWVQDAIAAGWKYWALVVPDNIKARMNLKEIVEEFYSKGVRVMVFTDPDEAMEWLENVDTDR